MSLCLFVLSLSLQSPLNFPPSSLLVAQLGQTSLTSHSLAMRADKARTYLHLHRCLHTGHAPHPVLWGGLGAQTTTGSPCHCQPVVSSVSWAQPGQQHLKPGFLLSPWAFPAGDALGQVGLIFSPGFRFGTCPFSFVRICAY